MDYFQRPGLFKHNLDDLPESEVRQLEKIMSPSYGALATTSGQISSPIYMISAKGKTIDSATFIAEDINNPNNLFNQLGY